MAFIKAIHVQCDGCKALYRDADWGRYVMQARALRTVREEGWTHGKRDLCPTCQPRQHRKAGHIPNDHALGTAGHRGRAHNQEEIPDASTTPEP